MCDWECAGAGEVKHRLKNAEEVTERGLCLKEESEKGREGGEENPDMTSAPPTVLFPGM